MAQNERAIDYKNAEVRVKSLKIDGYSVSAAELAVVDGATSPIVASKVVIADADKDIVGARKIWLGTNGVGGFAGEIDIQDGANPGVSAALTYADLYKIDAITNGTQAAGKAVVADANVNTGISKVTQLHIGTSGSETQVTASAAELNYNDVTTAGVAEASKAVILGAAKEIATITTATITNTNTTNLVVGIGGTVAVDNAAVAATGNDTTQTATVTTAAGTITTGALTTAANAATSVVLTLTGVDAGDLVLVVGAGGTNTTPVYIQSAVATTNTITVTLRNGVNATTALNGTVAFHYVWIK